MYRTNGTISSQPTRKSWDVQQYDDGYESARYWNNSQGGMMMMDQGSNNNRQGTASSGDMDTTSLI